MVRDEVQIAVDRLAVSLQRSVVINDAGVHLLYSSSHYGDEDQARIRAVLQREADAKVVGHVLAQGVSTWTTAGVIPANEELGLKARVCVPIRWRGGLLGLVMVMDGDGTLTTTELSRITDLAVEVAPVMALRDRDDPHASVPDQAVLDLVGREPVVRRRALADLVTRHEVDGFDCVTAIELGVRGSSDVAAPHIRTALRGAVGVVDRLGISTSLSAVGEDGAVILLGSSAPLAGGVVRKHAELVLERLHDLSAGRFEGVAGVGSSVWGLDQAADTAKLARLARRAAETVLRAPVVTWADLGAYGPLLLIPDSQLDETALPDEVQRLLAADRGQHLADTVRAYLDHGCVGPAASAALHIHRTTLYYRLGRITELTGLDLADGRTRLVLHLGLAMLDLIKARSVHQHP